MVEAAVSAQERLRDMRCENQAECKIKKQGTYIKMATTAISSGYTKSAKLTPRIYHMTPFIFLFRKKVLEFRSPKENINVPSHSPSLKTLNTFHKASRTCCRVLAI